MEDAVIAATEPGVQMQRISKQLGRGAQHFESLCKENGITIEHASKIFLEWSKEKGHGNNVRRNTIKFLTGESKYIGRSVNTIFVEFCRVALNFDISQNEFNINDRIRDYHSAFLDKNMIYNKLIEMLNGEYILYRPRAVNEEIIYDDIENWDKFPFKIFQEGNSERYSFEYKNGTYGENEGKWIGPAICGNNYLYLFGYDQLNAFDVLSMIMTPLDTCPSRRVLIGVQFMRLVHSTQRIQHDMVVCRKVAAVKIGQGQEANEVLAKAWMRSSLDLRKSGFVFDLRHELAPGAAS